MKLNSILLILMTISITGFHTSCATTHHFSKKNSRSEKLAVSCGEDLGLSHGQFRMFSCSFENTSKEWIKAKVASVKVESPKATYKVSLPEEIKYYKDALVYEKAKANYNRELLLSGLVIAGVAAMGQGDKAASTLGAATIMGVAGYGAARAVSKAHNRAQYAYGDNHVLGEEMVLPPELFLRKSFLVERTGPFTRTKNLQLCFSSPEKECFDLKIR